MNDSMKFLGIAIGVMGLGAVIGFTMFPKQMSLDDIKKELMNLCQEEDSCKEYTSRYFEQCSQDELTEGMEIKQVFECIQGLKNIEDSQVPDIQEDVEITPQEEDVVEDSLNQESQNNIDLPIDSIDAQNLDENESTLEDPPLEEPTGVQELPTSQTENEVNSSVPENVGNP